MRRAIYSLLILLIMNSFISAQTINIGFRLEGDFYSDEQDYGKTKFRFGPPIPSSAYLKAAVSFPQNLQIELKSGIELGSYFGGPQYAALVKYEILRGLSPLITYLLHYNWGDSRNAGGAYEHFMSFLGGGIEVKITKAFAMDLIYYKPLGENRLTFTYPRLFNREKVLMTAIRKNLV